MPDLDVWAKVLTRRVQDGALAEEDAKQLYRQIRRGALEAEAIPAPSARIIVDRDVVDKAQAHLSRLSPGRGIEDRIQDAFEASVRRLTTSYARGSISLAEFHTGMQQRIAVHTVEQVLAGAKRNLPTADQYRRIQSVLDKQSAHLSKFMDEVAVNRAQGKPLSVAQIRSRAESYSGSGRAEFSRAAEGNFGEGWIALYEAIDDKGTCGPCLGAEAGSPYALSAGPMPGELCLGRGRCRCRRVLRYDPATYRRLAA